MKGGALAQPKSQFLNHVRYTSKISLPRNQSPALVFPLTWGWILRLSALVERSVIVSFSTLNC